MKDIAAPYCNWTPDAGAKSTPIFVFKRFSGILAICAFVAIPLMSVAARYYPEVNMSRFAAIAFLAFFASIIAHSIARSKASTAQIRCSRCGEKMKHTQHNYPTKANTGLRAGCSIIEGGDGRQYIFHSGSNRHPEWARVLQQLKICPKCKRYAVIEKMKLTTIGRTEQEVHNYELLLQRQHRALAGKNFKPKKA